MKKVLEIFIKNYLPDLFTHIQCTLGPIQIFAIPWFFCLYIRVLPWDVRLLFDKFIINSLLFINNKFYH